MGSDERSLDGDTSKERRGQVKNVVKERRKCNNTEQITDDVFNDERIQNKIGKIKISKFKPKIRDIQLQQQDLDQRNLNSREN